MKIPQAEESKVGEKQGWCPALETDKIGPQKQGAQIGCRQPQ